jgi:uncharacterized protein (TIGR02266 family)
MSGVPTTQHNSRAHERIPLSVEVEYRTASSFLVAYSVNLSRGGLFLESHSAPPIGSALNLELRVPGGEGLIPVRGRVTWTRGEDDSSGPPGFGVAFEEVAPELGALIDQLVAQFSGLTIVVLCPNQRDCPALARTIRSIIHTADVVSASEAHIAETLVGDDVDLLLIIADDDPEAALRVLERRGPPPRVPAIVLTADASVKARAVAAGADEVAGNPPAFADFQKQLVRALGRPRGIRL